MEVKVHRGEGKLQHVIEVGSHQLLADVPQALGGDDTGIDPHDLLAASLASCTALTVTMYARRKQMDLQDIDVRIQHEDRDGGYAFNRRIHYIGNLSAEEKKRLTEIANKCPVHKILSGTIRITTEMD